VRRSFRITTAQGKVGFVVGAVVVEVLVLLLLLALGVPDGLAPFLGALCFLAVVVVGVRTFRGPDEPVEPPRPWWRMTAGPVVGFLLAAYFVGDAVLARTSVDGTADVGGLVVSLLVAAAYAGSSVTLAVLRAQGRPAPGSVRSAGPRDSGSDPVRG
jgi:membrane protease YdiL (CAAX protease family)